MKVYNFCGVSEGVVTRVSIHCSVCGKDGLVTDHTESKMQQ